MTFAEKLRELAGKATGIGILAPVGGALWHAEMEYAEYELREFLATHATAIAAVVEAAERLINDTAYVQGMSDADPQKGAGNYLADALSALNRTGGDDGND